MPREISIAKHNINAKKKFEEWVGKKPAPIRAYGEEMLSLAHEIREYALREAIDACTDDNSRENIKNLI